MEDITYSIKELANLVNTNKQTMRRFIIKNKFEPLQEVGQEVGQKNKTILFNEPTKNAILKAFQEKYGVLEPTTEVVQETNEVVHDVGQKAGEVVHDVPIEALQEHIEVLQNELIDTLRETIQDQKAQIEYLTKLLDQEQKLNLATQQRLIRLEQKEEPTETDREPQKEPTINETDSEQVNVQEKKMSRFEHLKAFLFGSK